MDGRAEMRRISLTSLVGAVVLALLYLPIGVVFVNSFNADESLTEWGGFTLEWFEDAVQNDRIIRDFRLSIAVAVVATLIALVIAVCTGLATRHMASRGRAWVDLSTLVRIILPEVVIAVGLFLLIRQLNIPLGFGAIVVGHVVFLSAYATVIVQARFASMTNVLEEAASDLGAPPWRAFMRVTLPMLVPAIVVAGLLCFTFSFDDVVTSLFLGGPQAETLPVLILGLVRVEVSPLVNAVAMMVMFFNIVTLAVLVLSSGVRAVMGSTHRPQSTVSTNEELTK